MEAAVKTVNLIAATLIVVGGLNWGLVGLLGFDLVAALLGEMSVASRAVYALVGLSALYRAVTWRGAERGSSPSPARA